MAPRMTPARKRHRDRRKDVEIPFAPHLDDEGNEVPCETKTARGLLLEAQDEFKQHEQRRWPKAILNERYISGDQQWGIKAAGATRGPSDLVVDWPDWLPRTTRNLLRNLHLTAKARVTRGDPSMKAWGGDPAIGDAASADVTNKLIYALRTNQDHRKTISRAAGIAGAQGTACFYATWNAASGPLNDDGSPQGDVSIEVLQVFDWGTDGSEDIEKSPYFFARRWMKRDDAKRRLLAVGVKDDPDTQTVEGIWGSTTCERVAAVEYWHKPTPGVLPAGLMIVFIDGHVVEAHGDIPDRGNIPGGDVYPYKHNELPGSIWKWVDVTDSPFGGTPCDDAVPLQAHLNRLHSALAFITAKSARWLKVETSKKNVKLFNGADQILEGDPTNPTKIISAPAPPALIYTQIEEAERMLREVYGVNEAVVGSDASKSKNAKHLEHIEALDAQKLLETIVGRDHALFRMYRQCVALLQQFVVVPRLLRFVGEDGLPAVLQFVGADLSTDIYLEPAPGADQSRAAAAADAEQAAAAGYLDPARAAELRQSGQRTTAADAMALRIVQKQIADVAGGFSAQPDPSVPVEVAAMAIQLAVQQAANTPAEQPLLALLAAYQQQQAQQQPAPAPSAARPKATPRAAQQPTQEVLP